MNYQYNHPTLQSGSPLNLDDSIVMFCCTCGSLVLDTVKHSEWHSDLVNAASTYKKF